MYFWPDWDDSWRNVFVGPDVFDDDYDCHIPGADNTQGATD